MSDRMAFLADMDNPYITLQNDYIESVWNLLDGMFKKGLVYEGAKSFLTAQDAELDLHPMKLLKVIS